MATADATPLMPHATAAWLVDNTGLTFVQIAEYCGILSSNSGNRRRDCRDQIYRRDSRPRA